MAVSITSDLAVISNCDTTTSLGTFYRLGGAASGNPAADADAFVEGVACIANKCSGTVSPTETGGHFNSTATFDITGQHLFVWRLVITAANMLTKASGGIVIGLTNTSTTSTTTWSTTTYKKWYVDGSDTMPVSQGWKCYVIDPTSAGDISAGVLTLSTLKNVGLLALQTSSVTATLSNIFTDVIRMGTGLTAITSVGTDVITFQNIYDTDRTTANAWGILTRLGGIYYGAAKIVVGSITQTNVCLFTDTDQVLVWRDYPVSATLYEILIKGASGFKTTMTLTGCTIKGQAAKSWLLTCNDAFSDFKLYSSALSNASAIVLSAGSIINGSTISACGLITSNGAVITDTVIQNTTAAAALLLTSVAESNAVDRCTFSNNARAIKITTAGTYTFDGHAFSGNTYDVENSSAGAVIIENINTSNAITFINTGGGSTTIKNIVTITIRCINENNSNLEGIVVYVENASTKAQILSASTNASGIVTIPFDYPGTDVAISIRMRRASTGATKYTPIKTTGTITSTGFSLTATMYVDTIVAAV